MSVTNPSAINMSVPDYTIDQIIGVFTNTLSVAAPAPSPGKITVTDVRPHGFGDSCYFQGIFTTDGGITYNDFGAQTPNLAPPEPQFQTVDVEAVIDTANVNISITNFYDVAHSTSSAYTVTYKIYLLAKNSMQKPITPIKTNNVLLYNSSDNYQKTFLRGTVGINVAGGATGFSTDIIHNLQAIPKIRAFFLPASSPTTVYGINNPPLDAPAIEAHITTTDLVFYSDQGAIAAPGVNGNIEYRVYLDS